MIKKKKIIAITVPISAVLIITVISLIIGCSIQHKALLAVQTNDIKIELDNKEHTVNPSDFIDETSSIKITEKFADKNLSEIKITADSVYSIDEKIKIKYKKAPLITIYKNVKIKIVDNTPPEFTEKVDSITINKGEELDVVSKFNATDLSGEVKITVDGTIDINTVGTQTVNIFATDESGNVAQTEVNVIVNEPEKNETTENNNNETASKSNNSTSTSQKSSSKKSTSSSSSVKNRNTGNNKTSSNSNKNNSSSSKPNSNTTTKPNNNGGSATTTSGCASGNHSMPTGNCGKWFNSRNEAINYYNSVSDMWNSKYDAGEISYEELCKKCPFGYECWSCSNCGKWTLNYKYI